jgi:hypothetical protein
MIVRKKKLYRGVIINTNKNKGENMTMIILDTIVRFIPIIFIAWIVFGKGNKC